MVRTRGFNGELVPAFSKLTNASLWPGITFPRISNILIQANWEVSARRNFSLWYRQTHAFLRRTDPSQLRQRGMFNKFLKYSIHAELAFTLVKH